jgi:hypothetical protein
VNAAEYIARMNLTKRRSLVESGAPQLGEIRCLSAIVSETLDEADRLR